MGNGSGQVTQMLSAIAGGERRASETLFPLVYDELRAMARAQMTREQEGHMLQPTALVHEVYLRLLGDERSEWPNRRYFFAAAAEAMRRILVEHARSRQRVKRGGRWQAVPLETADAACQDEAIDWLELDEAIRALEAEDARLTEVVHLRFFAGLDVEQTALALGVSARTVKRNWRYAKAFLLEQMTGMQAEQPGEAMS